MSDRLKLITVKLKLEKNNSQVYLGIGITNFGNSNGVTNFGNIVYCLTTDR